MCADCGQRNAPRLTTSADCGAKARAPLWIEQPEILVASPAQLQAEVRLAELLRGWWMGERHRAGKTQHTHLRDVDVAEGEDESRIMIGAAWRLGLRKSTRLGPRRRGMAWLRRQPPDHERGRAAEELGLVEEILISKNNPPGNQPPKCM